MAFRYLLYVSDRKVDSLLEQIDPSAGRWRATKVRVGLTFLEVERTREANVGGGRFERLDRVLRFLLEYGDVGDVDEPRQFFAGTLPMRWGPYPTPDSSLLYFGGRTERTVVGLGGSVHHALDSVELPEPQGLDRVLLSDSSLPRMLDRLGADRPDDDLAEWTAGGTDGGILAHVCRANRNIRYPAQDVEFVAKRLLQGPSTDPDDPAGSTVLLGSPLYVAVVD